MSINSIYFLGLGALGAKYASSFYNYNPVLLKIIVDKHRKERYEAQGIYVNEQKYNFEYITSDEVISFPDLIILTVKSADLSQAIQDLKPFVGDNTLILSLMNGITSERILAEAFGWNKVINAVAYMDAVKEGNKVTYGSIGKIIFGEITPNNGEKLQALHLLMNEANIPNEFVEDIQKAQWSKYVVNVVANQLTFLLEFPYGEFRTNEYLDKMVDLIGNEVIAVGNAHGIEIGQPEIDKLKKTMKIVDESGKTSMLQDREAKRYSEVDEFSGEIIRLGKMYGVPTPYNELIYNMVKAIEKTY